MDSKLEQGPRRDLAIPAVGVADGNQVTYVGHERCRFGNCITFMSLERYINKQENFVLNGQEKPAQASPSPKNSILHVQDEGPYSI